ncbi:MAG: B12-binding domain-containing radical SAM protein, partial [Gemmatimonadota bacterium]|nr:B12-binding domain-containing radical SAM protein [Gemmatimonadota bacterium]
IGGLHATAVPQEAMQHCDGVVTGEGEISWPGLLNDFRGNRLQPLYQSEGRQFDLAAAPLPRFDLLDASKYNRIPVQTQRGCPWRCDFCASSIALSPRFKVKPVASVLDECRRFWFR